MPTLSDDLRQTLPEDRAEALDILYAATWQVYQSLWEPGGEIYKFGSGAWRDGMEAGKKDAIRFFADNYQITEKVDIPDPDEEGWDATFEAFAKTKIPKPMTQRELADLIGYSYGYIRRKKHEAGTDLAE